MIIAPTTCNTLAKWAAGISDTLPLSLVVEAAGKGLPAVTVPFSNRAQLSFPAVAEAREKLERWAVTILAGTEVYSPREPRTGNQFVHPWRLILAVARDQLASRSLTELAAAVVGQVAAGKQSSNHPCSPRNQDVCNDTCHPYDSIITEQVKTSGRPEGSTRRRHPS